MRLEELARKSHEAARVRAYQTHPDVIALRIELVRAWSARIIWAGVVLGLAFTMTNVQQFAASGAHAWSLAWCSAWLLDPMVSLVLIGVLVAEQVTSRWELPTPVWARRTKWFTLAATYAMNTWLPWSVLSAAGIVLHSVPPLLVFTAVEGGPAMREALTHAVAQSLVATTTPSIPPATSPAGNPAMNAAVNAFVTLPGEAHQAIVGEVHGRVHESLPVPVHEPVHESTAARVRESRPRRSVNGRKGAAAKGSRGTKRMLLADYLAIARERLSPDMDRVTPAWCRQVTGCSDGTSVKLAAALNAEHHGPSTATDTPDNTADAAATDLAVSHESRESTDPVELEGQAA